MIIVQKPPIAWQITHKTYYGDGNETLPAPINVKVSDVFIDCVS